MEMVEVECVVPVLVYTVAVLYWVKKAENYST